MFGMARRGAAFVVRQHGQVQGELLGRPTRKGATRSGPVYEQPLLVRDPDSGETMRVRRITIKLTEPTRDGDTELHILSNVPTQRASAAQLARLYGKRWSIETAFFEITTTLSCEINTLGYPKAALFTFCLALLAYNAVSLIKAALRSAHGRQKVNDEVSSYYLSLEIGRTYDGMMIAIPAPHWALFRELSEKEFANALRELASSVNLARYQKHPRGPKKKPRSAPRIRMESTSRLLSSWHKDDHIERAGFNGLYVERRRIPSRSGSCSGGSSPIHQKISRECGYGRDEKESNTC